MRICKKTTCVCLALALGGLFYTYTYTQRLLPVVVISRQPSRSGPVIAEPMGVATKATGISPVARPRDRPFKILYWTIFTWKGSSNNWFGLGGKPFQTCEYQNCFLTNDTSDFDSSDAVLFYVRHATSFPTYRFPQQKWILRSDETPIREHGFERYNSMFNATWTYHSKSDIYSHTYYEKFTPSRSHQVRTKSDPFSKSDLRGKKGVAWFASACSSPSQRRRLVSGLQKYMPVDIYGRCGPLHCGNGLDADCDQMLSSKYRFYLSFENSLCEEYVTEKLWRAYHHNVIPVVMGASDYASYLPEHSYIDVGRFPTVRALADYLTLLDGNDTLYMEYFAWKKSYQITYYPNQVCALCRYMNERANVTKVYERMDLFWDKKADCFSPQVYYRDLFRDLNMRITDANAASFLA